MLISPEICLLKRSVNLRRPPWTSLVPKAAADREPLQSQRRVLICLAHSLHLHSWCSQPILLRPEDAMTCFMIYLQVTVFVRHVILVKTREILEILEIVGKHSLEIRRELCRKQATKTRLKKTSRKLRIRSRRCQLSYKTWQECFQQAGSLLCHLCKSPRSK